ncbi:hypothetical protein FXW78_25690 [Rhodococcus opacus]|nr:hypothetical protein [Rhodococcus opacus]
MPRSTRLVIIWAVTTAHPVCRDGQDVPESDVSRLAPRPSREDVTVKWSDAIRDGLVEMLAQD